MVPTALVVVLWLIIDHASGFLLAPTLHTALRSSIPSTSAFPTARRGSSIPLNLKKGCGIDPDMTFGPNGEDLVWEALRSDAKEEASKEPLLASFMHASILSHKSLERCLAYHMANLLNSPAMISTQIQALFLEAFEGSDEFRQSLRLDILAVMIRDPAIKSYTDVILYFKGFQALQTHRVSHWLWHKGRITLGTGAQRTSRRPTIYHPATDPTHPTLPSPSPIHSALLAEQVKHCVSHRHTPRRHPGQRLAHRPRNWSRYRRNSTCRRQCVHAAQGHPGRFGQQGCHPPPPGWGLRTSGRRSHFTRTYHCGQRGAHRRVQYGAGRCSFLLSRGRRASEDHLQESTRRRAVLPCTHNGDEHVLF
mmetsp:Transcript_11629/g.26107  ORF Transcript_11629/g.26107 Transcript_11629/m.26107 type:complete len:364 (-) Transcript_11629:1554-2645(-)